MRRTTPLTSSRQYRSLDITGVVLNEIGVVAGNDMTPECAFVKLSYLLAQDHLSLEAKKRWLGMSMVGEMASVAT
jgi:lysophospholipase